MIVSPSVHLPKTLRVTDEEFLEFVKSNPDIRFERAAVGELIAMSPTGSQSGHYNSELNGDVVLWNRQQRLGKVFDSSTGFHLPNGAIRSPDVAWVAQDRWDALAVEQQKGFAPLCPDFVIELVSETDDLATIQAKMQEYIENGCRLGWLINPKTRTVEIYRCGGGVEMVSFDTAISGEDVLLGFQLNLRVLFSKGHIE
ncbi:Uma2 family endonuclease [Candidatus Synechococcus calcipolaris G9]|uniref:Uma2 family endonuclease n=1 Tax=Candidatus Synechococcus calcipolaris G9 TaxID=1497997 RepID=A0ABT6EXT6_9SYNE|nr:Uma2 family endonuclease [Candidatus Synechococcus calcipolaris]MDG2990051.1 Uma2 family endonuclease [Candidatus Synechococcus calcipolaris G9]